MEYVKRVPPKTLMFLHVGYVTIHLKIRCKIEDLNGKCGVAVLHVVSTT